MKDKNLMNHKILNQKRNIDFIHQKNYNKFKIYNIKFNLNQ